MTTLCLHCDTSLTTKDLTDGWCDGCGKKLPSSLTKEARRPKASTVAQAATDDEPMAVWKVLLAVLLVLAFTYFATTAILGDRGSLALFLKIGVRVAVVALVAVPVLLVRALRGRWSSRRAGGRRKGCR